MKELASELMKERADGGDSAAAADWSEEELLFDSETGSTVET